MFVNSTKINAKHQIRKIEMINATDNKLRFMASILATKLVNREKYSEHKPVIIDLNTGGDIQSFGKVSFPEEEGWYIWDIYTKDFKFALIDDNITNPNDSYIVSYSAVKEEEIFHNCGLIPFNALFSPTFIYVYKKAMDICETKFPSSLGYSDWTVNVQPTIKLLEALETLF